MHVLAYFEHKKGAGENILDYEGEYDDSGGLIDAPGAADEDILPEWEVAHNKKTNRRAINMLPCRGELNGGRIFDSYGRSGRGTQTGMGSLPCLLDERSCTACERGRRGAPLDMTDAMLYTMGGLVSVGTGAWTCTCCPIVRYDGADSALFACSSRTVFTRIYFDILLQVAISSRSSLTAVTAAVAFCLHVTAGLPLGSHGHTRKMLNVATAAFRETLIIPASTYACERCLEERGSRKYRTMIADGQVLGFFRDKAHPFMRTTVDNPVVDVQLKKCCAVKSTIVRSAIRKRCSGHILKPSSLTALELRALDTFSL